MNGDNGPKRSTAGPRILVSDRQDTPVDLDGLAALAARTLEGEGRGDVELSLSFVASEEMEDLHVRFMGEAGPTDVLSFPLDEDGLIGDVVVCPSVAEAGAARNGGDAGDELRLLVVHGVLHLLGYDHQERAERAVMWARQERYSGVRVP
jgi:probable rRNA maturation factor